MFCYTLVHTGIFVLGGHGGKADLLWVWAATPYASTPPRVPGMLCMLCIGNHWNLGNRLIAFSRLRSFRKSQSLSQTQRWHIGRLDNVPLAHTPTLPRRLSICIFQRLVPFIHFAIAGTNSRIVLLIAAQTLPTNSHVFLVL